MDPDRCVSKHSIEGLQLQGKSVEATEFTVSANAIKPSGSALSFRIEMEGTAVRNRFSPFIPGKNIIDRSRVERLYAAIPRVPPFVAIDARDPIRPKGLQPGSLAVDGPSRRWNSRTPHILNFRLFGGPSL